MRSEDLPPVFSERGQAASLSRLVAAGGFWSLLGRFGHSATMLLGTVILARTLTPGDFGLVAITSLAALLMLGVAEGLIDIPIQRVNDLTADQLQSLLWTGLGVAAGGALLVGLSAPALEHLFGFDNLASAFWGILPIFFLQVLVVTGRALYRRQHRFLEAGRIVFLSAICYALVAVALSLAGFGFWSLIIGQVASNFVMAGQFLIGSRLSLGFPRRFDVAGTAIVGVPGLISGVLGWFWSSIDTMALGLASNTSATGLYSRAYNLSTQAKEPFEALNHPIRQALVAVRERGQSVEDAVIRLLRLMTLASAFVTAAMIAAREEIIAVLLGAQWDGAVLPFALLVAALPARIALNVIDNTIIVSGAMWQMVKRHGLMALIIGANMVWAAPLGPVTVSLVVSASMYLFVPIAVAGYRLSLVPRILLAMIPGLFLGSALVASSILAGEMLDERWAQLALIAIIHGVAALLALLMVPGTSLPASVGLERSTMAKRLKSLYRLIGNRGEDIG